MAITGSVAHRLDANAPAQTPFAIGDTSLIAFDGGGLDARVREGVSSTLTRAVTFILVAMVLFFAIGSASVALTSNAVAILQCNNTLESYNKTLTAANDDLRIERSLLTRADRVSRIATQNLNMVYAQDAQHFELR